MSDTVSNQEIARLQAVCAMLASSSEQERATAAIKATNALNKIGLTWSAVIALAMEARDARRKAQEAEIDATRGWSPSSAPAGFQATSQRLRERGQRRSPRYRTRYGWHIDQLIDYLDNNAVLLTPIERRLLKAISRVPRDNGLPAESWAALKGMHDSLMEQAQID